MGGKPTVAGLSGSGNNVAKDATVQAPSAPGSINAEPFWPLGTPLSMLLYTSDKPSDQDPDLTSPVVVWDGLTYGDWNDVREADLLLDVPESVRMHNATWWMDIVLLKGGGTDFSDKTPADVALYRKRAYRFSATLTRRTHPFHAQTQGPQGEKADRRGRRPRRGRGRHSG